MKPGFQIVAGTYTFSSFPTGPVDSGLTFTNFKFADLVRWTKYGVLHEGWVIRINKKSITVGDQEEIIGNAIVSPESYVHPSKLFKGHLS